MPEQTGPLAGVGVLVTRPAHQAEPFCRQLEGAGAVVTRFPVIAIAPFQGASHVHAISGLLAAADLAIFISRNAVEHGLKPLLAAGAWPAGVQVGAVGRSTGEALVAAGNPPDLVPTAGFNTEALLALPPLQDMTGRTVVIFRGQGGRETLAETLRARGASVDYAEVYRRVIPAADPAPLRAALDRGALDVITVTSNESLRNLHEMVGTLGRARLLATPLVVASERAAELARSLGFSEPATVAEDATDDAMFAAVTAWRNTHLDNAAD